MTKEVMKQVLEALTATMSTHGFREYIEEAQYKAIKALEEALKQKENNFNCKTHPDAPHGFVRNASHSEDRYVCECEFWEPPEQDEPVAYINVEQRKLEWAKYTSWETPTVVNLPKIPLYTTPQGCAECGVGGGYALYCLSCAEKFIGNKEWVGLTADELNAISDRMRTWNSFQITDVYFAIEAKLKETNHVVSGK